MTEQTQAPVAEPTFGGVVPNLQPSGRVKPEDQISLEDPPAPAEDNKIDLTQNNRPLVSTREAGIRAEKADFALGANSPGKDVIAGHIANGSEDIVRNDAAMREDINSQSKKQLVIKEFLQSGNKLQPGDVEYFKGLTSADLKADPTTILEKLYARRVVNTALSLDQSPLSVFSKGMKENPDATLDMVDHSEDMIHNREITKTMLSEVESQLEEQSWGGYLTDQAKSFIPFYSAIKQRNLVTDAPTEGTILPGSNIGEQLAYLWKLPPSRFYPTLRAAVDQLREDNPSQAKDFLEKVDSYSNKAAELDNILSGVDAATLVSPASLLKGGKVAASIAKGAAKVGIKATDDVANLLKSVVKATSSSDKGAMLAGVGDLKNSARATVAKAMTEGDFSFSKDAARAMDPARLGGDLRLSVESISTPRALLDGAMDTASGAVDRLALMLEKNAAKANDIFTKPGFVSRLTAQGEEALLNAAEEDIRRTYNRLSDSVLRVERITAESNSANVSSVVSHLGKPDSSLFQSRAEAYYWGQRQYRLDRSEFDVVQNGLGYEITITKHGDETLDAVRKANLTEANKTPRSLWGTVVGWGRSAEDQVSKFNSDNRHALTHGNEVVRKLMQDVAKPISDLKKFDKGQFRDLGSIMEFNRDFVDPVTKERGFFYNNLGELQEGYRRRLQRLPSEQEAAAYFAMRQLNDIDYVARNMGLFRDKARLGIENIAFNYPVDLEDGTRKYVRLKAVDGKLIDNLPFGHKENAGVYDIESGQFKPLHEFSEFDRTALEQKLQSGYRIVQIANPMGRPLAKIADIQDTVHFVITNDFVRSPLDWQQLPYKPGFHVDYPQEWFVKQANVRSLGDETVRNATEFSPAIKTPLRRIYEGDKTVFGFATQAEAKKYAEHMDVARKLLKDDNEAALRAHLEKNLPFTYKQFTDMFESQIVGEPPKLDINESFLHTETGRNLSDSHPHAFDGYENAIRSEHNLYDKIDKKFAGTRDPALWTIDEGTEANPLHNLTDATPLDIYQTANNATSNIMRSRFLTDYKVGAVESWVQEFGHLMNATKEELAADPLRYLHRPDWAKTGGNTAQELRAAKNAQAAIIRLLGSPTDMGDVIHSMKQQMLDAVYGWKGQPKSDLLADHLLSSTVDPIGFARSVVFHTTMGFWNIAQFALNLNTMVHMVGVAGPVNGVKGGISSLMMNTLRLNKSPEILDHIAGISEKWGWKKDWFKEAWAEMEKSGINLVSGEHTWTNTQLDPKVIQSKVGNFLHMGTSPFREAERQTRMAAFNIAYLEWRQKFPNEILDNRTRNQILTRADTLNLNMTRASDAAWQTGAMAIPMQFASYPIRLAEQFLGGRLSVPVRARMFATYSAAYGIPSAASVFGMPVADWMRQTGIESSWDLQDPKVKMVMEGIPQTLSAALGFEGNISQKYGPGGIGILKDLWEGDKSTIETLLGPAGTKGGDIIKAISPLAGYISKPFRQDPDAYSITNEDVVQMFGVINTMSQATRAWIAVNSGQYMSKKGVYQTDVTPFSAVLMAATGTQPQELSDAYMMVKSQKDLKTMQNEIEQQVKQDYKVFFTATANGEDDRARVAGARINFLMHAGQFTPQEWSQVFMRSLDGNKAFVPGVEYSFAKRSPERIMNLIGKH